MDIGASFNKTRMCRKTKNRTLRMPAKFADMSDEEAEYDGGLNCFSKTCFILSSSLFAAGGICWALNYFFDVGDKNKMYTAAEILACAGATTFVIGLIGCCRSPPREITEEEALTKDSMRLPKKSD